MTDSPATDPHFPRLDRYLERAGNDVNEQSRQTDNYIAAFDDAMTERFGRHWADRDDWTPDMTALYRDYRAQLDAAAPTPSLSATMFPTPATEAVTTPPRTTETTAPSAPPAQRTRGTDFGR